MKLLDETVFVGVYGALQVHTWLHGTQLDEDAYSLFVARSTAMGWPCVEVSPSTSMGLSPDASQQTEASGVALWGMNDADQDWGGGPETSRVIWLQVSLLNGGQVGRYLPISALLSVVEDVISRVGMLRLDGVQLLLPTHFAGISFQQLAAGKSWFATSKGHRRVSVNVTLDSGESPLIHEHAALIADALTSLPAGIFILDNYYRSTDEGIATVQLTPPVVGSPWLGEGHHETTFTGTLPEWSLDSLAWVVSAFAEACRRSSVLTTVLTSVTQSTQQAT